MSRGSLVGIVEGGWALGLDRITELLPVPETTFENDHLDWDGVEERIGHRLPEVYKEFVSTYGTGSLGYFMWVLNPFSANRYLNFDDVEYRRSAYQTLKAEFPEDYLRDPDDFFPWALTDNGDSVVWLVDDGDPNQWLVCIQDKNPFDEDETGLTTQGFLEALLEQTLTTSIFPEDFLEDTRHFTPVNGAEPDSTSS